MALFVDIDLFDSPDAPTQVCTLPILYLFSTTIGALKHWLLKVMVVKYFLMAGAGENAVYEVGRCPYSGLYITDSVLIFYNC